MVEEPFQRLPDTTVPIHYDLELAPDLEKFTFKGNVTIHVKVIESTDTFVLNSLELSITSATFESKSPSFKINVADMKTNTSNETLTLKFPQVVEPCEGTLLIHFTGELNDSMKGFYRSKYITPSGEKRYAAVTQFEATDARRCFPCWDEPAIKATFNITLVVPADKVALSNMPLLNDVSLDKGMRRLTFDRTPIMSTYLVAVVIGEFDYVETKSEDGILVRVYTPVGRKEQGLFALDVASKVLPYYKSYFNVAYPLPKIDLIAIADFSAGAMENWGLVTYRETLVLVDEKNTSLLRKQAIALTVGHEIAHQWFGNLVTMEWWTHLWLNEGYASFVEFLCVDHIFPSYDIWNQFVSDIYTRALELDSLENSHPIEVPVNNPAEIDEIFDGISYNKGASVIRMLHHYIGDNDFRKGMHLYLTRHQYKNTKTEDLWAALEEASSKPVTEVMSNWIKAKGFPVVSVDSVQKEDKRILKLKQAKFTANGSTPGVDYIWVIPITVSTSKAPNKTAASFLLKTKEMEVELEGISENDWIKINPGTVGFYRTKYSTKMWEQLMPAVASMQIPPLDRLGLIDDIFAMVQAGSASIATVLELFGSYRSETNYTVWASITQSMTTLQLLISHTKLTENFNRFGQKLYRPTAERLGWDAKENENHLDTLLRSLVLGCLVSFRCKETIKEGKLRFKRYANGEATLPADLRIVCYIAVLLDANEETFQQMLSLYRSTELREEQDRIARSFGSCANPDILRKVIDFAMSDEVRSQDALFIVVAVAMNPAGREMTWQYFKDNHAKLMAQYQGGFLIVRLIKYLIENFATEEKAQEVEEFFKVNQFPGTERTVAQAIETIRLNVAWLKRNLTTLTECLSNE